MAIEQLGRVFNLCTSATTAKVRVNLKDAAGVGIVLIGATAGAATISEANAASGGTEQVLAVVTRYYTQAATGLWTKVTQAAGSTVTAAAGGLLYVYISGSQLSDGFQYICASHASGSFVYVMGDLNVDRAPASLAAAIA